MSVFVFKIKLVLKQAHLAYCILPTKTSVSMLNCIQKADQSLHGVMVEMVKSFIVDIHCQALSIIIVTLIPSGPGGPGGPSSPDGPALPWGPMDPVPPGWPGTPWVPLSPRVPFLPLIPSLPFKKKSHIV